jgi:hypothetical protein
MYVIWTEHKNVSDVIEKATELFSGDNVIAGHAHYKGMAESSLRIEIFDDKWPNFAKRVYGFAQWIALNNNQESVAVQRQDDPELVRNGDYDEDGNWTGRALPSVIRNEFGYEQLERLNEPEGVYENGTRKQFPSIPDEWVTCHMNSGHGRYVHFRNQNCIAPTVELPPGDTSDIENPFGAIDGL